MDLGKCRMVMLLTSDPCSFGTQRLITVLAGHSGLGTLSWFLVTQSVLPLCNAFVSLLTMNDYPEP